MIWALLTTLALLSATNQESTTRAKRYAETILVGNLAQPGRHRDEFMINGWGVALRPAGLGGHWWINNAGTGTVSEYVGDVGNVPLHQDELKIVHIARSPKAPDSEIPEPTGIAFSASETAWPVTHENGVAGPSRFIFCTTNGTISGWTERKNTDGSFTRDTRSVLAIDNAARGAAYFGCAVATDDQGQDYLYAANFALGQSKIEVYGADWKPRALPGKFANSEIPRDYSPWNVQAFENRVFVAYAKQSRVKGEEEACAGCGFIAEFDLQGRLIANWNDKGFLNAPWSFAIAPSDFGAMSGMLLVSNFGDGSIVAFDCKKKRAVDYLRGEAGAKIKIDGI